MRPSSGVLKRANDADSTLQAHLQWERQKNDKMKRDLYLKGNTVFYKNDVIPQNLQESYIDRIVNNESMLK